MQVKIFTVPIIGGEQMEEELNHFLRGHRVVEVNSELVQAAHSAYWTFCIRYLPQSQPQPNISSKNPKVDYRKVLDAPTFEKFAALRQVRKELSKAEAVPAYAIFTDEELAQVAKLEEIEENTLLTLKGVGEKKLAKFGAAFIRKWKESRKDEKS